MRLRVNLRLERAVTVPINYQHLLTGVVYRFLQSADADYARFLHSTGYAPEGEAGRRRFKLFCFSPLRARRRRIAGEMLWLGPGEAEWLIASPVEKFLSEFASGLLSAGDLRVGSAVLPIAGVETLPAPPIEYSMRFKCLSPLIISRPVAPGSPRTVYLTSDDAVAFSEGVRRNLIGKYRAHLGHAPRDDRLELVFDQNYLRRLRERGQPPTKLIDIKGSKLRGVLCPFTLTGSTELIGFGYDTGYGEKNSLGFGLAAVEK